MHKLVALPFSGCNLSVVWTLETYEDFNAAGKITKKYFEPSFDCSSAFKAVGFDTTTKVVTSGRAFLLMHADAPKKPRSHHSTK